MKTVMGLLGLVSRAVDKPPDNSSRHNRRTFQGNAIYTAIYAKIHDYPPNPYFRQN
jgi:hypothetical protein